MSDITDIVSRLRRTDENRGVAICSEAADTIERLRKERDEARREVLMNETNHLPTMADPFREAKRRGWACLEPHKPWDCHKDYK